MIGPSELAREFWERGKSESCPIYDMHGHMGLESPIYFPRAETADMIRTMDECGVRMLTFCHHVALNAPELGNRLNIEAVHRYPDRLRAYCAINPNYPEIIERDLASFAEHRDVFVGLKFLSDYQRIALTDPRCRPAWEYADAHGLLVLCHTWSRSPYDGPEAVREIAERYPHIKLLLGHSLHDDWDAAIAMARDFPHVYLELTAVFDDCGALEKLCAGAGSDRMLFGTDLPWFDPHQAVGALLSADISDEDRHNICHRNAERLLAPFLGRGDGGN